ncbi:MAG: right-handed parallel beta-helix repeat-containing protein, partial [Cyanobacteria bacterium P01_D01_bin.73]
MAILTVTTFDDVIDAGDGLLSLREAISQAQTSDTIVLSAGNYLLTIEGADEDFNGSGDLDIFDKAIAIIGAGEESTTVQVEDRASDIDAVFNVLRDSRLALEGVSVVGGSVVNSRGKLQAKDVTISGVSKQSALISDGGETTLIDVDITNNRNQNIFREINGGGIASRYSQLTLIDTTVSNNASYGGGAGIFSDSSTVTLISSAIVENLARGKGGGIASKDSTLEVRNSSIIQNSGEYNSGGIYTEGGTLELKDSTLSSNKLERGGRGGLTGTGLLSNDSSLLLDNVLVSSNDSPRGGDLAAITIFGNTASLNNVAIFGGSSDGIVVGGESDEETKLTLSNSSIFNNEGIGLNSLYATLQLDNISVQNNEGGGIYSVNSSSNLTNAVIRENGIQDLGGGVHLVGGLSTIRNAIISGNYGEDGGGIQSEFHPNSYSRFRTESTLSVENATISDNRGSGIFSKGVNLTLKNSVVSGNRFGAGGGIHAKGDRFGSFGYGDSLQILNSTIKGNSAASGGGLHAEDVNAALQNVAFYANEGNEGGAIFVEAWDPQKTLNADNLSIIENRARKGAGIYASDTSVNLSNTIFALNAAQREGGGIYGRESSINGAKVNFWNNFADLGSGIWSVESDVTLDQSTFFGNRGSVLSEGLSS